MTAIRRRLFRSCPLLLLALATTSARAADDYLKLIPSTALAWGAVNHMNEASEKIKKLAVNMPMPAVDPLDEIKKESGLQKGLDEKGAAGFFVLPSGVAVYFVAVADEKAFLGNFQVVKAGEKISEVETKTEPAARSASTYFLAFRNGYALLSSKKDRTAVEAAVEAKQSIAAEMAGLEPWMAENDGTVAGTAAGIKYVAKLASKELKESQENMGQGPDAAVLRVFMDAYGAAMEAAPKEISLAVAGIRCDKQGSLRLIGRARLVNGGQVSKAVAGIPPLTEKMFAAVPGGPFAMAAGGVGIPKLLDAYANLATGFLKGMKSVYGTSEEDMERMSKESLDVFRQVRSIRFVMKTGKRGDPIYSNMFCAMGVDNSQRFLAMQEKYAENTNKLLQNAKQGMLKSITVKRLEIAGQPALQQEVNFDLSNIGGAEANRAALDAMLGIGGKMLFYHVAADEHTVLMGIGVSQERMAAALDVVKQPRKSLAEDADVSLTAAMLPADAQWVAYISPRGYMQMTERLMTAAMRAQQEAMGFSMPSFSKSPPIGFAVKATPAELHAEIAFPSALIQAYGEYTKEVQKMFMNRARDQNPTPVP